MNNRRKKYEEHLSSKWWKRKKARLIERRGGPYCKNCGRYDGQIELHHLTYERFGHEDDDDLELLCQVCHWLWHRRGSRPSREFVDWVLENYGDEETFWPNFMETEFADLVDRKPEPEEWLWET